MVENNKRNVLLAVAGAGLLLGAAILLHYANSASVEEEEEINIRDLLE